MKDKLLLGYQVMATVVGINLLLVMAGLLKYVTEPDSWWNRNAGLFLAIDQIHGVLFMALIVLIARLTIRQKWSWGYMVGRILLACIPVVSFWTERTTSARVHRENLAVTSP